MLLRAFGKSAAMLIFFLDIDPVVAASLVPNGHMRLVVECGQIFDGVLWFHSGSQGKAPGYANHPFTVWVRESSWAWDWCMEFARAIACVEYPNRYAEKKRSHHGSWDRIRLMNKPSTWKYTTMEETPLCPLPAAVANQSITATTHAMRAIQFRIYHVSHKNKDRHQFLYEPRARRPKYLPARTPIQEEIVQRHKKKLKIN